MIQERKFRCLAFLYSFKKEIFLFCWYPKCFHTTLGWKYKNLQTGSSQTCPTQNPTWQWWAAHVQGRSVRNSYTLIFPALSGTFFTGFSKMLHIFVQSIFKNSYNFCLHSHLQNSILVLNALKKVFQKDEQQRSCCPKFIRTTARFYDWIVISYSHSSCHLWPI